MNDIKALERSAALTDEQARQRALAADTSFIVQAPAGSGKTELLIQRFLRLLAIVPKEPEEVLAITFTRKAASEMRSRVMQALFQVQTGEPAKAAHEKTTRQLAEAVLQRDQKEGWHLLHNPNRLRIQTIDALCASLVRRMPTLSGLGGSVVIAEDPSVQYRAAVRQLILSLEKDDFWQPALKTLLLHLDNNIARIEQLLVAMLGCRDHWLGLVGQSANADDFRALLEHTLADIADEVLSELEQAFSPTLRTEVTALLQFALPHMTASGDFSALKTEMQVRATLPPFATVHLAFWQALVIWLLTEKGTVRRSVNKRLGFPPASAGKGEQKQQYTAYKQRMQALLAELEQASALCSVLNELRAVPLPVYAEEQWQVLAALSTVLPVLAAHLSVECNQCGVIDFTGMAQAAERALGEHEHPSELALALDYHIHHILIDEFQDTSLAQFRLLEKLTTGWHPGDGRSLFLVGDPMQSIYRFREAEVGLFLRAERFGVGNIRLQTLRLQRNFRSEAAVVDWVNHSFKQVMPKQEDISLGAIPYRPSAAVNASSASAGVAVHTWANVEGDVEASAIVGLIKTTRAQHPEASIAILVRARSHLLTVLPALSAAGLDYHAVEVDRLIHKPVVQDLLALTRALQHAADEVAWFAVLRAPWCGLTLQELHTLAQATPEKTVWQRLQQQLADETTATALRIRLTRVARALAPSLQQRGRQPLAAWVKGAWFALGAPACYSVTEQADADLVFEVLRHVEATARDVAENDDPHQRVERQLQQVLASRIGKSTQAVQIMTVHKAKGLEFDTVIMPSLARAAAQDSAPLLLSMQRLGRRGQQQLILAPIQSPTSKADKITCPIYTYVQKQLKKKATFEMARLLYVGATRAKRQLHLLATVQDVDIDTDYRPKAGSFLAELWPVIGQHCQAAWRHATLEAMTTATCERQSVPLRRLPLAWSPPSAIEHLLTKPLTQPKEENSVAPYHSEPAAPRLLGIFLHRLLCQLARAGGVADLRPYQAPERSARWVSMLRNLGIVEVDMAHALERVRQTVAQLIADPRAAWILDPTHSEAYCEQPLSWRQGKRVQHVVIDRSFVDATTGTRWIIDYKFSCPNSGQALEAFLAAEKGHYKEQLQRYAKVMRAFVGEAENIACALYFPLCQGWIALSDCEIGGHHEQC